jgi:uncharacterized membrane protein YkgB
MCSNFSTGQSEISLILVVILFARYQDPSARYLPFHYTVIPASALFAICHIKPSTMTLTVNNYVRRVAFLISWINRTSLFIVYFWFGLLKLISKSPAEALIADLHRITIGHLIRIKCFLLVLGTAECLIGILWLVPRFTKWTMIVFFSQMITTFLPLFITPDQTWSHFMVLSLSGQYILKNIVLVACALTIYQDYRLNRK